MPRLIPADSEPVLLVNTVEISVVSPEANIEGPEKDGSWWVSDIEVTVQITAARRARDLVTAAARAAQQACQALTNEDPDPDFDARAIEALS